MIDFALQAEQVLKAVEAAQALLDKLALDDEDRVEMQDAIDTTRSSATTMMGWPPMEEDDLDDDMRRLLTSGYLAREALEEWTGDMQMVYDRIPAFRRA